MAKPGDHDHIHATLGKGRMEVTNETTGQRAYAELDRKTGLPIVSGPQDLIGLMTRETGILGLAKTLKDSEKKG